MVLNLYQCDRAISLLILIILFIVVVVVFLTTNKIIVECSCYSYNRYSYNSFHSLLDKLFVYLRLFHNLFAQPLTVGKSSTARAVQETVSGLW